MSAIQSLLGAGFIGVVVGYLVKYFLDYRQSKKLEELNKKRKVYEDAVETLGIFISSRSATKEQQDRFLECYSKVWLWAPDDVVRAFSDFLEIQIALTTPNSKVDQNLVKAKYANCVIEMRKDLGFPMTALTVQDYKFVSFS